MRILAIRGENLASLPHFDLDFEAEPIRDAGIFAITGPTGAGKSTILDAICLAFFDRLPRLADAEKRAKISRGDGDATRDVGYADVRNILRHGCGAGLAEVEFVGQDGRRYRARWSVHRSRNTADGSLQGQKLELIDLATGETIGHGKTETLVEIRKRVGLDFEQFRRAALLAQNEFDMFIRSDSETRASLLERITGTDLYSRISKEAFERAKRDRSAVEMIDEQLAALEPLDDVARRDTEQQIQIVRERIVCLSEKQAELDHADIWYRTDADLVARVESGKIELAQAENADRLAGGERDELVRSRSAFSVRSELEAADAAQNDFRRASEQSERAGRANVEATAALEKASRDASVAEEGMLVAQRVYDEIGPELTKATELDARIGEGTKELERRDQVRKVVANRSEIAYRELKAAEEALASNKTRVDALETWINEHQSWSVVASRIDEVVKDLEDLNRAAAELVRTDDAIVALESQRRHALEAIDERFAGKNAALQRERVATGEISSIDVSLGRFDRTALSVTRDAAVQAQAAALQAERYTEEVTNADAVIGRLSEQETGQSSVLQTAREIAANADGGLPVHEAALEEARRALDLSEAAGNEVAERLRLKLVDDEPCPVCGATEHHLDVVNDVLRARVVHDHERVTALHQLVLDTNMAKARAEIQQNAAVRDIERLHREREAAEVMRERATRQQANSDAELTKLLTSLGIAAKDIEGVCNETKQRLAELDALEKSHRDLAARREEIRQEIKRLDEELASLRQKVDAATASLQMRNLERNTANVRHATADERLDRVLVEVLPQWREIEPLENPIEKCRHIASAWTESSADLERIRGFAGSLALDLMTKRAESDAAERSRQQSDSDYNEKAHDIAEFRKVRKEVIDGRSPGVVRTEYRLRAEQTKQRWHGAESHKKAAQEIATTRATELAGAMQDHERCARALGAANDALTAKLASLKIDVAFARNAIQRGEAWADSTEARLTLLRDAASNAGAVLEERQNGLKCHRLSSRPSISKDEIAAAKVEIDSDRENADKSFHLLNDKLRRDDDCRERVASLRAELTVASARSVVSGRLSALIGSADGSRFRDFAQSLTFERLVDLANAQLRSLYPRYELARTRGKELALQVIDHDMADEARGVHSLSGGERFLVSLALALGLASMSSAQGVRVDSLFIDEGFGALDSNSLNLALVVLEQLQVGGRQIGIISHIDVLEERIGVRIAVTPEGAGRSRVDVVTG